MPINDWSDSILIAELGDEPSFSEEMDALSRKLDDAPGSLPDVIVDVKAVSYVNSSNIAQLLKVRKKLVDSGSRLRLCAVQDRVWSVMLATGLDSVFDVTEDISTSLASLQISEQRMLALRRPDHETRIEIMPLIDVIFLLLTFFIYAMVLMIRAELLPVEMQEFAAGVPAQPAPAVTISIDRAGDLYLDRELITMETVIDRLRAATARNPETVIYLAAEATGDTDRLPAFLTLYDRLAFAGLDIKLVGRAGEDPQ